MKLVLHIGPFKTGSSAIQDALHLNRAALAEHGIDAPDIRTPFVRHAVRGWPAMFLADPPLVDPMLDLPWSDVDTVRAQSAAFMDGLRASADVMCLSSEFLSIVPDLSGLRDRLRQLTEDITVVAYVRGPHSFYVSQVQQQIRGGLTLQQLDLPRHAAFQCQVVQRYRRVFGPDNLIVRHFHRDNLVGGDVVEDFRQVLAGLTSKDAPKFAGAGAKNESLTGAAVAWLLTMNQGVAAQLPARRRLRVISHLMAHPELRKLPKLELTDPVLRSAIDAHARADCEWLNYHVLRGQVQMDVGTGDEVLPGPEMREALGRWLMSHVTPEAMGVILRALNEL